jgi:glycerophosphoryl diester phosphodiesterase
MRLSEFIVCNVDPIVAEWEQFAASITPAADYMDAEGLRDHAKAILLAAARDMNKPQSADEQAAKAKGEGPEKTPSRIRPAPAMVSCATSRALIWYR